MSEQPKICHFTSVHAALDNRIFYRECVTLASVGYRVVVVAPAERDGDVEGVRIRAIPKPRRRLDRMTKTTWSAYRTALQENAAIYHFHDPELLPFGFLLRALGKSVIYDAHEDVPDDILTKAWVPLWIRATLAKAMNIIMLLAGEVFSGIVAATPKIAKRFPNKKTAIVANYPIMDPVFDVPKKFNERPNDAIYIGSLTKIRGILQMVEAFSKPIIPQTARLVIAGAFGEYDGAAFEREISSVRGWERVNFLGWVSQAESQRILRCAKIGLVLFHPEQAHLDALPAKLFEYMAAGLPVVASDFPLWREIVAGASCGLLVNPLDCDAIAGAIAFLFNNPDQAEEMGLRGRQLVLTRYSWAEQADRLLELYKKLGMATI